MDVYDEVDRRETDAGETAMSAFPSAAFSKSPSFLWFRVEGRCCLDGKPDV